MQPREAMKYAILGACQHLGVNAFLRTRHRRQLLIVLYHGVISAPGDPLGYCVHLTEFDRHMEFLSRRMHPVSLAEVIASVEHRASLPDRAVRVTFDCGYRNN